MVEFCYQLLTVLLIKISTNFYLNKIFNFFLANEKLFIDPTWFLGICDISTAYDYLLEDRSSYRPGKK